MSHFHAFRETTGYGCRTVEGAVGDVTVTLSDALLAHLQLAKPARNSKLPCAKAPAEKPLAALSKLARILDKVRNPKLLLTSIMARVSENLL